MTTRLYLLLLAVLSPVLSQAQTLWYQPGQSAVEIRVSLDGLYALSGNQALLSGLTGAPLANLKLYHNGQEASLRIQDADNSGTWTTSDTLWFFGVTNRGEAERGFQQVEGYANPWSPLYGKAGKYYLLNAGTGGGLRMAPTSTGPAQTQTDWTTELVLAPRQEYSYGMGDSYYQRLHQSFIGNGEGWSSAAKNVVSNFTITNPYTVRNAAGKVIVWVNGRNNAAHRAGINVGTSRVLTTDFDTYTRKIDSATFPALGFGASIPFSVTPLLAGEYQSLMLARLQLPVQASVANRPSTLACKAPGRGRVKLPASLGQGLYLQVADPLHPKVLTLSGSEYLADADSTGDGLCAVWLQRQAFPLGDTALSATTLNAPPSLQSNALLILTSRKLADTAQLYADYRSSLQGGGHAVQVVKVEDVYNQYGYGYASSEAIRVYLRGEINRGHRPKSLFLMGKGLQAASFTADSILREDLVPSWGVPTSDNLYTATDTGGFYNKIPTGRLAARSGRDILAYLNKVKAQESNPDQLWRKKAFHLSGGKEDGEIEYFRNFIRNYSDTFRAPLVGGTAYEYSKQSTSVIEAVNIRDKINAGLNVLLLFGHSASTTTDIDIGQASDPGQGYENMGRCPLIIVNGCFAGNVFERAANSLNENWVLSPNRGAIAFSGGMDEGLPALLDNHTKLIYRYQFSDSSTVFRTLGEIYQLAARHYLDDNSNIYDSVMVTQTILHGDPMLRLFPFHKPDFTFDGIHSRLVDQDVSAYEKSFALRLQVQNRGQFHPGDSVSIIGRITNANGPTIYGAPIRIPVMRQDTAVDYRISGGFELDNGSVLECTVDYLNQIAEESEENNALSISLGRFESGVSFISPTRDAIVASSDLRLIYRNLAQEGSTVEIEIDTTRSFTSGLLLQRTGGAGLTEQNVVLPSVTDSTVFYLRYRTVMGNHPSSWRSFAFTLIQGQEGWSQTTGIQYAGNDPGGYTIDTNRVHRAFSLAVKTSTVRMRTVGDSVVPNHNNTGIDINGIPFFYGTQSTCYNTSNQLFTLRLNQNTLQPSVWNYGVPDPTQFWRYGCGRVPISINLVDPIWPTKTLGSGQNLWAYLIAGNGHVPGDYYFAMSTGRQNYASWDSISTFVLRFEDINPAVTRSAVTGSPAIWAGRRLQSVTNRFQYGVTVVPSRTDNINDERQAIDTTFIIRSTPSEGQLTTGLIGPALRFTRTSIQTSRAAGRTDSALFTIRAYRSFDDTGLVVYHGIPKTLSLQTLIPSGYRYIRLSFTGANRGDSTTYLEGWRVLYQPYPEGVALSASATPVLDAGDIVRITAKYHNSIGIVGDGQPLETTLFVRNNAGVLLDTVAGFAIKDAGSDTSRVAFNWKSDLTSPDTLGFEVQFNVHMVPERNYLNNSAFSSSILKKDTSTYTGYFEIDGLLPEDGQKVGDSPQIVYRLNHDFTNRKIALLFGPSCDSCSVLPVSDFNVIGNTAYYNPKGLAPGRYEVRATVTDRFRLLVPQRSARFEVIARDTLTLFSAYPNPANQSVTFTYQCAAANNGGTIDLSVVNAYGEQVYTGTKQQDGLVAGKLPWDLRQNGDPVLPGVYLARLRITVNAPDGSAKNVLSGTVRLVVVQ